MEESFKDHAAVTARIMDANTNRCAEGLRVVEEVARFALDDMVLFKKIKQLRHDIRHATASVLPDAPAARDSEGDPGASFSSGRELTRSSFTGICRANFMRAEEGLRVLEEFSKLIEGRSAELFKRLRFDLYTIEKKMLGEAAAVSRMPEGCFLYTFLDRKYVAANDIPKVTADLIEGGSDIIQYRAKGVGRAEMLADLVSIIPLTTEAGVPLIVNDRADVAMEAGADGVHLGASDGDASEAREILGENRIVGLTIHSVEDIEPACVGPVDYLGVGSIYPTKTKTDVKDVGTSLIEEITSRTSLPVVGIGGIGPENIDKVFEAGALGAAVVSAVLEGDIRKNCFTLKEIVDRRG